MQSDQFSGSVFQVFENVVYEWNPAFGVPQTYTWRSKEFVTPKPVNFGACKFEGEGFTDTGDGGIPPPGGGFPPEIGDDYQDFNDIRFLYPLNPLNMVELNGVKDISEFPDFVPPLPIIHQNSQPFHESPLFRTLGPQAADYPTATVFGTEYTPLDEDRDAGGSLLFRLYANRKLVYEQQIDDFGVYRLPGGYKATLYQFEFVGTVHLQAFKIAETPKELMQI
jgi:hypothetical protein